MQIRMRNRLFFSVGFLIVTVIASPVFLNWMIPPVSASTITPPRGVGTGSWNPHVPCTSPWIVRISDITDNMTESASLSNSMFSPGINSTAGQAKRWLTPGTTPPGWVSPGPPCTITDSKGQTVASFVEIDGVGRSGWSYEDCRAKYDTINGGTAFSNGQWCDSTGNLFDPTMVSDYSTSCVSPTDPTCGGRIHVEFDGDWMAIGTCGISTSFCNNNTLVKQTVTDSSLTLIDVQGYIYWDPGHVTTEGHSFSGWELHPFTAWRPHKSDTSQDHPVQITQTGCPNAMNCSSGNYPTQSSFFLPFTQQKLFQNPRPTSRQDYYVFYRQNMSIPGSGCTGGTGPDFCDECVYAYSPNGVTWRVNQTIGSGLAGLGNFYYNCSATYFDNTVNSQLVIYVVATRNSGFAKLGHNVEFAIGTVADAADTITWGTVQTVSASSSTQNFQFPVLQVDPNGYLQIAYSWVDTSVNRQTVDLCSSRTAYPISNPLWTCHGSNNSLFDAQTQFNQTDASFMPQLQPVSGHSVLVIQGPCSNIATSACDGPSSQIENATLVNWDGTRQTFIRTSTFAYPALSSSDRRSSTSDRATGTIYIAYENGTDGKFWTRYLSKPYTAWTLPIRITGDDGEGRISLLSGTGTAKKLVFVEAVDTPNSVSKGGGNGSCGPCPQIDMYVNVTSNGTSWSSGTILYSNTTWAAAWASIPWYVNTTSTGTLPIMWEQHVCGHGTNVACIMQPEELWFDPHILVAPTITPPTPSFAVMTTFDGRIFKYFQNGSLVFISRPVGSALRQAAWKPDGSYALIVGDQGVVYRYDGTTLTRFSSTVIGNTNLNTVAWKPDGSYALIGGQNGLIFQYNGTAVTKVTDPTTSNIFSISWNPLGNSALIVGDKGTALMYKPQSKITILNSGTGQPLFAASWNPTGTYALAGGGQGVVLSFNGTIFKSLSTAGLAQAGHNIRFIAFNPAGNPGIVVGDAGLVWTYDGTKLSSIVSGTNNNLFSLSWLGTNAYIVGQNGVLLTYSAGTLTKLTSGTNVNFASIAWQPHPLSVKFTFSPSSPTLQTPVSFVASPNGGFAPYSFNWNLGDGTSTIGNSVNHSYSSPGSYNVTVTVTDSLGSTSKASSLITVQASSPVVNVSSLTPNPAVTGATVTLSFTISSSTNVTGVSVNWGDGTSQDNLPGNATKDTHVYTSTGTFRSQVFNITITATNSAGSSSGTTTETVNDRPPAVTISSVVPNPATNGQAVNASFTTTDPDGTVSSITVNWGDSSSTDALPGTATLDTHSYSSTGTFTITVVATDNSGSKGQATTSVTVQSQVASPTVTVNNPTPDPTTTGATVRVTFAVSSSSAITGITVNWGDGTSPDNLSGTATSDTHTYSSTGSTRSQTFTINVTATNSGGAGSGTALETIDDQSPTTSVQTVTSPANTGQVVNVTFSAADPDGTISSISVNWGDGTSVDALSGTATSDSHIYTSTSSATSKIFVITISSTDNSGSVGQATTSVTINDRPPAVTVSSPSPNPALVGQTVSVSFSTSDPDGTISLVTVNWGDGSQPDSLPGTSTLDTHTYGSGGSFTITVTATDNSGSQGSGSTSESVTAPLAPTVTINSVSPNPANTRQTVTVTFTASSTTSITGITVNWGDGTLDSLAGAATSDTHIYASTGNLQTQTFTVVVTATNTAGSGSASANINVNDRAPTVNLTGISPNPAPTGSTVTATLSASDSDGTVSSITVNWGDGSPVDNLAGTATSDTHSFSKAGSYTITLVATDNSGSTAVATGSITVQSSVSPPTVTVNSVTPNPASAGTTVNISFSVTSSAPVTAISINWGDGTVHTLSGTATSDTHSYASAGNYTITVIATDSNGSSGQATTVATVTAASSTPYALTITADGKVYKTYTNGTMVLVGQPVLTALRSVSWKPDGSYALIGGDSAVLLKYDGTQLSTVATGISTGFNFWSVSWKPDGSYALVAGTSGLLFKYDGVSVTMITNPSTVTIFTVSWNPTGTSALLAGRSGTILTYDGTTVRIITSGTNLDLDAIGWNPNGQYALIGGINGTVLRFDGTQVTMLLSKGGPAGTNEIRSIAFNPQGTLALLVGDNGMILTYNGSTFTLLAQVTFSYLYGVSWGPNGTAYIVGTNSAELTYSNGVVTKVSSGNTSSYRAIAWKP